MSTEKDLAAVAAAWLDQAQGVAIPAETVAGPARMAERFGKITREASRRLQFGTEPSGFQHVFTALADGEDGDGR